MESVKAVEPSAAQAPGKDSGARIAATVGAALGALCLCLGMPMSGYAGLALLSVIVFHVSLRPSKREIALIAVPAFVFWASYVTIFKIEWLKYPPSTIFVLGTLGAGSLTILAMRVVWSQGEERNRVLRVLFPAAGMLVFLMVKNNLINFMAFQVGTFDLHLFLADGSFGFHPAMSLWNYDNHHYYFALVLQWIYALLPAGMALVYAPHLRKFNSKYFMLQAFLAAGFLGWLSYSIVPAAGPLFVFGENFNGMLPPFHQLRMVAAERVNLPPAIFRNAVPSLHMTWAMLMVLNARKLGPLVKYFAVLFAIGTAMATMGTGQHYMVDLIVAVPFTLFIQAICTKKLANTNARGMAMAGGGLLALAWMLMLRFAPKLFLASIVLPWACSLGTFALVTVLFLRMEKAANGIFWQEEIEPARENQESESGAALMSSAAV